MSSTKRAIRKAVTSWFGMESPNGTYFFNLTRVKSSASYGTMTLKDFEEVTEKQIDELTEAIWEELIAEVRGNESLDLDLKKSMWPK